MSENNLCEDCGVEPAVEYGVCRFCDDMHTLWYARKKYMHHLWFSVRWSGSENPDMENEAASEAIGDYLNIPYDRQLEVAYAWWTRHLKRKK